MTIPYHKIIGWTKRPEVKRVVLRWLGFVILLLGVGLIVNVYQSRQQSEVLSVLPSGEEEIVRQSDTKVYIDDKEEATPIAESGERIVIPQMGVDTDLLQGGIEKLSQGVWLMPDTSTPDKGGNTVITAHRWKYQPPDPRTFYNLDKLALGDKFDVFWQGKKYSYEVYEIKTVTPEQTEILYPTKDPIVTLFSCTPLYSTSHRLVVRAKLVEE